MWPPSGGSHPSLSGRVQRGATEGRAVMSVVVRGWSYPSVDEGCHVRGVAVGSAIAGVVPCSLVFSIVFVDFFSTFFLEKRKNVRSGGGLTTERRSEQREDRT